MRIVIAQPPISDFYTTPHRISGLGPAICAKMLMEMGHEVFLINFPAEHRPVFRPLPPLLGYLKPFIIQGETGPLRFFGNYRQWGPDFGECALEIMKKQPDLVCISLFAFAYAEEAVSLAKAVKNLDLNLPVAAGGAGITALPEYFEKSGFFDYVVSGEAESVLAGVVETIVRPGRKQREKSGIIHPVPVIAGTVVLKKRRFYSVSIARGCPEKCCFCSNFLVQGQRFRKASLDSVRNEVLSLHASLNLKTALVHFNFEDDNILIDTDYFIKVLKIFRKFFPHASFSAENGLDYRRLSPEIVNLLTQLGFTQLNLSLGSVCDQLLKKEKRKSELAKYEEVINSAVLAKLPSITYIIAGFRNDTPKTIADSLAWLAEQPTRIGISCFYPVPGISGFAPERFFSNSPRLCLGSSMYPWNESVKTKTLVTAFRLARLINLMKDQNAMADSERRDPFSEKLVEKSFAERKIYSIKKEGNQRKVFRVEGLDTDLLGAFFKTFFKK